MDMNDRILAIMEKNGLSRSEFADSIGIGKPVLSHILSGRNNPSLSVVQKILETFPETDPLWLIMGSASHNPDLPSDKQENEWVEIEEQTPSPSPSPHKATQVQTELDLSEKNPTSTESIIIFHSDGTFSEYRPKKRSDQRPDLDS